MSFWPTVGLSTNGQSGPVDPGENKKDFNLFSSARNKRLLLFSDIIFLVCRLNFVCSNFLFLIADFDAQNLNKTRIPVYFTHTPAGKMKRNMKYHYE